MHIQIEQINILVFAILYRRNLKLKVTKVIQILSGGAGFKTDNSLFDRTRNISMTWPCLSSLSA